MDDGSFSSAKPSRQPYGKTRRCALTKTHERPTTAEECPFAEECPKKPIGSEACVPRRRGTPHAIDYVDAVRRNGPLRPVVGARRESGISSQKLSLYQASKMWDPVSVVNTFPLHSFRLRCRGKGSSVLFSRDAVLRQATPTKSSVPRGAVVKNSRPVDSTRPPFHQAEWLSCRTSALARAEVRFSLSPFRLAVVSQGDSEEICEVEVEGHGLVQIFREGERFAARILERTGPFSRSAMVPLCCKGLTDPEEATRCLTHLPKSALRHRVHVLSDRKRGVERFVYVGGLGLLGGGDREPPSSSDALGRETAAQSRPKKDMFLTSPYVVPYFAGRKDEFGELLDAFTSSAESVVVKAIVGPGGIGKTQLAIKVLDRLKNKGNYDDTFWIHSDSRERLSAAFMQLAERLEIPADDDIKELVARVHEGLEGSRCLFVFDDAPDLDLIREYLPPTVGHAIVTTRDTGARDWESDTLELGPFDDCDSWFLAQRFGYTESSRSKGLDDLLDLLPPYPLPLAQFFSMMDYEDVSSPAEWLYRAEMYAPLRSEAEVIELLSAKHDLRGASAMVFSFHSSVISILRGSDGLGTRCLDILIKLALLDPNGVPFEWVCKWHGDEDGQSVEEARRCIRLLERFSYVSWNTDNNQIYMHAETQLLARHLLLYFDEGFPDERVERARESAVDHMSTIVHSIDRYVDDWRTDRSNREAWTSLARNGVSLLEHFEKRRDIGVELNLVKHISRAYDEMCMFTESLSYEQRALEMCERLHDGADHPDLVECIQNYAVGLSKTGRDIEAQPFCLRALEMCERLHGGADHPDLVECIRDYAVGLSRTGRDIEAQPFDSRALEMCERLHGGADHPNLVMCIRDYAVGLSNTGRDIEAQPFRLRALEMCERLHGGADHPDLVDCIREYAIGLSNTGRDIEAQPFRLRALEMCERLHGGADHPDLVECIRNYAVGLSKTGRDIEVQPFHLRALEMCERLHGGEDHPDLVMCIRDYAVGLSKTGRDIEAQPFHLRALEMCERLHGGADHPNLAECIRNYAVGLSNTGRDIEAQPFRLRALEMCERLHGGADHPDLVDCIRNYAVGLSKTGRDIEAQPFHLRALEMCERLHGGADHPNLVMCIRDYAVGLSNTGRDIEAQPFRLRALEMCERLHGGADHPDLVECIRNYAVGLSKTGRDIEAQPFRLRALEMCERLHGGADHPNLAECIRNYAVGLSNTGRDIEAQPFHLRALEMCERLHGGADHPNLAECIRNYAVGLSNTGRDIEAQPFHLRALEMCERLHGGADHSDLVECIQSYAVGLSRTGRDIEAQPFRLRALEMCERLHGGADHPDIVTCIRSYAVGLSRTGRDSEAQPFRLRALEMCERLHGGADHPDLVDCIRNYAVGLSRTGRDSEAVAFNERAEEMRKRLGD